MHTVSITIGDDALRAAIDRAGELDERHNAGKTGKQFDLDRVVYGLIAGAAPKLPTPGEEYEVDGERVILDRLVNGGTIGVIHTIDRERWSTCAIAELRDPLALSE